MDGKRTLNGRRKKPGYKNPGEIHQGLTRTERKKKKKSDEKKKFGWSREGQAP